MTQAQDAVLHPGRLVIIRRQVVVGQEGPSPKGTESGSEPLDLDVLSHPLSCMSCRVPAKVYNRAPSIAAAGVESGCASRGES